MKDSAALSANVGRHVWADESGEEPSCPLLVPAQVSPAGTDECDNLDLRNIPVRPLCARCRRRITVDTDADDDLWREVIGPTQGPGYICADCFTREADERMIDWTDRLRFRSYSMARQLKIQSHHKPETP